MINPPKSFTQKCPDCSSWIIEGVSHICPEYRSVREPELLRRIEVLLEKINLQLTPLALDLALPPAKDDTYKIEWLDSETVRLTPSQ